jgi:1-acyl-sn-glycerol-3-phosphate acyltransferase
MLYRVLRWAASVALRWYYRDIEVIGADRLPPHAPLLLAGNHPNALVDALVICAVVGRPIRLTAKATLAAHPALRLLFRALGIVPLRRASDEAERTGLPPDPERNVAAFRAVLDALERRDALLVFPEGRSHSEPQLAPLRTGLARMALQARDERGIRDVSIVPIGLTFECKWEPRSAILVVIGEPLAVDDWPVGVEALTAAIDGALRGVTLNFPTDTEASDVLGIARTLSAVYDAPRPLGAPHTPLARAFDIARRVEELRGSIDALPLALKDRAGLLRHRLHVFERELAARDIPINDLDISTGARPALRFLLREAAILALVGPVALWGRLNHWLPLRAARWRARRSSRDPDDPATHTIATAFMLVTLAYAVQAAIVWRLGGPWWAFAYLTSLPASATWDFRLRDRTQRAARRMRTWRQLRMDPALARRLRDEAAWLRAEALAIEHGVTVRATAEQPG